MTKLGQALIKGMKEIIAAETTMSKSEMRRKEIMMSARLKELLEDIIKAHESQEPLPKTSLGFKVAIEEAKKFLTKISATPVMADKGVGE